jgi:hypothetical protein
MKRVLVFWMLIAVPAFSDALCRNRGALYWMDPDHMIQEWTYPESAREMDHLWSMLPPMARVQPRDSDCAVTARNRQAFRDREAAPEGVMHRVEAGKEDCRRSVPRREEREQEPGRQGCCRCSCR